MHNPGKRLPLLFALLFLGGMISFRPQVGSAANHSIAALPPPVTPEPYPYTDIYPAEVYLASPGDLQTLYRLGIELDGLKPANGRATLTNPLFTPSIATIYIDPDQSLALVQAGLEVVPIPNEGYRSFLAYGPGSGAPNAWPTFEQYVARMQSLADAHPNLVSLVQIGQSVMGRGLYCMEITDNPGVDENEPEFKYSANHHGDETTGVEMTMRLAELLAISYGTDPTITEMVDSMEIWLCPIYNPDGYTSGSRYNHNGYDLNRNYPDRFTGPPQFLQPETQAFMSFEDAHRFVMGANYHGGAQVLNYPWDAIADPDHPEYAPDDALFRVFGIGYTSRNIDLWTGGWPQGITRGWEWYMIYGGMQDWDYNYHGEHHVTLEISNNKMPAFEQMDSYWEHNRNAMLWWMQQARTGLGGLVLDARDHKPLDATLTLAGRAVPNTIRTDPAAGDYHRVISAGSYTLEAAASCYQNQAAQVEVISNTLATHDFYLDPLIDLSGSAKTASSTQVLPGEVISYSLHVENACLSTPVLVTDTLPTLVTWTGYLTATQGSARFENGQILWQGDVDQSQPVTITYATAISACLPAATHIANSAMLEDGMQTIITRTAEIEVINARPGLPASPTPPDQAEQQPITTTLSWAASHDLNCDPITYDVYFGSSENPGLVAEGLSSPAFDPGSQEPGTTYYWYVDASDGQEQVTGPTWRFSTASPVIELNTIYLPLALKRQ